MSLRSVYGIAREDAQQLRDIFDGIKEAFSRPRGFWSFDDEDEEGWDKPKISDGAILYAAASVLTAQKISDALRNR